MDGEGPRVRQENVGAVVGFLLGEKAATIKELREDYDVEDMLDIYDCLMAKHANAYWAYKDSMKTK